MSFSSCCPVKRSACYFWAIVVYRHDIPLWILLLKPGLNAEYSVFCALYFSSFKMSRDIYSATILVQSRYMKLRTKTNSEFWFYGNSISQSILEDASLTLFSTFLQETHQTQISERFRVCRFFKVPNHSILLFEESINILKTFGYVDFIQRT